MKKMLCAILIAAVSIMSVSCSQQMNPAHYSKLEEIARLPSDKSIIGVSPDGKLAFYYSNLELGALFIDIKPADSNPQLETAMSLRMDNSIVFPTQKKL